MTTRAHSPQPQFAVAPNIPEPPPPPIIVTVDPTSATLTVGDHVDIESTVENASNQSVTWSASPNGIVSLLIISPTTVRATGLSAGEVVVTATSVEDPTKNASCSISVSDLPPPPVTVTVEPTTATITVSETVDIVATVLNAGDPSVTWDDDPNGIVSLVVLNPTTVRATGLSSGDTVVTATSVEDPIANASCAVAVDTSPPPPPITVSVSPSRSRIQVGDDVVLTATVTNYQSTNAVTWSTSSIHVSLSPSGNTCTVTGVSAGTAIVVATSDEDPTKNGSGSVKVTDLPNPPIVVTVDPTTATVTVGTGTTITATVTNYQSTNAVTWSVTPTGIVTLTPAGNDCDVTGVALGEAIVTATSDEDPTKNASCDVTVEGFAPTGPFGLFYMVPPRNNPDHGPDPDQGADNIYAQGRLIRQPWASFDPDNTGPNFTWLDAAVDASENAGQLSSMEYLAGVLSPRWVWDEEGAQELILTNEGSCTVPWDPIFQNLWRTVNEAFAARYDGRLAYVKLIGIGKQSETFLIAQNPDGTPRYPADMAMANALAVQAGYPDAVTAWLAGAIWLTDMYNEVWPNTPFVMGVGPPFPESEGGSAVLAQAVDYGHSTYPNRFGIRPDNLYFNRPGPTDPSVIFVQQTVVTCSTTGFQFFLDQNAHDNNPPAKLDQALTKGIGYLGSTNSSPRGFIEVFPQDMDDPVSIPVLVAAAFDLGF